MCVYIVLFFIFAYSYCAFALDSDISITEIAAFEKLDHEWIEIKNTGATAVDLTGWKFFENGTNHTLSAYRGDPIIEAGEYAVIADVASNTASDYPSFFGTLIDSSWETLNESGEPIALKNKNGEIIEQCTYLSTQKHSLERKDSLARDYSSANWTEHISGNTIGAKNSNDSTVQQTNQQNTIATPNATSSPSSTPPTNQESSSVSSTQKQIQFLQQESVIEIPWKPLRGDIVINEFVSDPADEEKEWIELYNVTNKAIFFDGWTIEDGSKTVTHLLGTLGSFGAGRFFIVESPNGNLNNAGDRIILFNQNHEIIDEVSYGNYNDGNVQNNAPRSYDPDAVARTGDGYNTYNNGTDFKITTTRTKARSNVITTEVADVVDEKKTILVKDIQITEVLPNPAISEGQEEFIELFNAGKSDVDLTGWFLVSENGQKYIISQKDFSSTILKSGAYSVIERKKSNIALKNNGGDSVKLYQAGLEKASVTFTYQEKALVGLSAVKNSDGLTIWTKTPTPGAKNIFVWENQVPDVAVIFSSRGIIGEDLIFDASDTFDPERDPLVFQWDFGDGGKAEGDYVRHIFLKAGEYTVAIHVRDPLHDVTQTKHIQIRQKDQIVQQVPMQNINEKISLNKKNIISRDIILDQVYPNPAGRDNKEFISLKNISTTPIDMSGWSLKTEKSAVVFTFPADSFIQPQKSFSLLQEQSKLRLQNVSDAVYVFDGEGSVVDLVDYEDAPEDRILTKAKDGVWRWMKSGTAQDSAHASIAVERIVNKGSKKIQSKTRSYTNGTQENNKETPIDQIRTLTVGEGVRFHAVVSVEPGVFGKTLFYVAGSGIQIYNSRKDFPNVSVGDVIDVSGILQESGGETRIRISGKDAIRVISHSTPPTPETVETNEVGEETEGHLVTIKGEISEIRWPNIFIDDGSSEVKVYVKKSTNIPKKKLYVNDTLTVTGIVSQTPTGYRILPRYESDIVLVKNQEKEKAQQDETIPDRSKETKTVFQYLVAIGVTALLVSLGLFIQYRMKE